MDLGVLSLSLELTQIERNARVFDFGINQLANHSIKPIVGL